MDILKKYKLKDMILKQLEGLSEEEKAGILEDAERRLSMCRRRGIRMPFRAQVAVLGLVQLLKREREKAPTSLPRKG